MRSPADGFRSCPVGARLEVSDLMRGKAFSDIRSLLFVPGDSERRFDGALRSGADAVIFDLEDAVAPDRKGTARNLVVSALGKPGPGPARLLRINSPDSKWGQADVDAIAGLRFDLDGIVVPKASPDVLGRLENAGPPIVALIETAVGLRAAYEIALHPRVEVLMLAAADLGAELGLESRPDGLEIVHARSTLAIDSAAAGIGPPFDIVYLDTWDDRGLRQEAQLAKSLGFRGKPCIHPKQIETVNAVFSVSAEEAQWAVEVIAAYEAAVSNGSGATVLRGQLIDAPVVSRARSTLARRKLMDPTREAKSGD